MESTWPAWTCPEHRLPLTEDSQVLACEAGHKYAIRGGIPRFVDGANYASHFGAQWNHYRLTQLDSHTGTSITRDRVRRCIGEELWTSMAGKRVLECGCGAGRFTEILLEEGAKLVSIDLSSAVEANSVNFPVSLTHRIAQADILHLPFVSRQFDLVFCLGVVQHTPDPEQTIAALFDQVAPGGALILDHYTGKWAWRTRTAPLFRAILKRLPNDRAMSVTNGLVEFFLPWHKAVRNSLLGRRIVHRISPLLSYYTVFPQLDDNVQREWSLLDTHDSLTDWYKHWRTRSQIQEALTRLGLERIWCEYGGNGVEARGYRPL
jgi:2-polyprenyl-3-methyl-5-hydroxy-6-metoxy-1,4-benzoquinol methylase